MKEKSMKHPQKKIEDFKNEDSRKITKECEKLVQKQ
jgi:hypothetical protein